MIEKYINKIIRNIVGLNGFATTFKYTLCIPPLGFPSSFLNYVLTWIVILNYNFTILDDNKP